MGALVGQLQALQSPAFSRRSFVAKVATAGAVVALANPQSALAAEQAPKKMKFRGGKQALDVLHNGPALTSKEEDVSSGLLGKMGIPDISPDKDSRKKK